MSFLSFLNLLLDLISIQRLRDLLLLGTFLILELWTFTFTALHFLNLVHIQISLASHLGPKRTVRVVCMRIHLSVAVLCRLTLVDHISVRVLLRVKALIVVRHPTQLGRHINVWRSTNSSHLVLDLHLLDWVITLRLIKSDLLADLLILGISIHNLRTVYLLIVIRVQWLVSCRTANPSFRRPDIQELL